MNNLALSFVVLVAIAISRPSISHALDKTRVVNVINEYCKLDFSGARTPYGDYEKIYHLMAWENERSDPGWDIFLIVTGYKIVEEIIENNSAIVTVEYNVIGELSFRKLEVVHYIDKATFNLLNKNNEWKITKYIISPRISLDTALFVEQERMKDHPEKTNLTAQLQQLQVQQDTAR